MTIQRNLEARIRKIEETPLEQPKGMTLGEMICRKDFILSTNVERALYDLLIKCGLEEEDVIAKEKYDKEVGNAKERIYNEFSKMLGFKYRWDGFYQIEKEIKYGIIQFVKKFGLRRVIKFLKSKEKNNQKE